MAKMAPATKRERIMVSVLVIILVFGLTFLFGIKPMLDAHFENSNQIDALQEQKEDNDAKIALKPLLEQKIKKYEADLRSKQTVFYTFDEAWEAEREVTKLTGENALSITSIDITPPTSIGTKSLNTATKTEKSLLRVCTASVECEGSITDMNNFLAKMEALDKKAYIETWNYSNTNGMTFTFQIILFSIIPAE